MSRIGFSYSIDPFRMIGLIDISIMYSYGIEIVALAFYRSEGLLNSLDAKTLNNTITSNKIFQNNNHTQRENFELFINSAGPS